MAVADDERRKGSAGGGRRQITVNANGVADVHGVRWSAVGPFRVANLGVEEDLGVTGARDDLEIQRVLLPDLVQHAGRPQIERRGAGRRAEGWARENEDRERNTGRSLTPLHGA